MNLSVNKKNSRAETGLYIESNSLLKPVGSARPNLGKLSDFYFPVNSDHSRYEHKSRKRMDPEYSDLSFVHSSGT